MTAHAGSSVRPRLTTMLAIRGALAVVLGLSTGGLYVLAVLFPRVTANVLVLLFGTYVLLDGLLTAVGSLRSVPGYGRWLRVQGVLGLCVGAAMVSQRGSIGPPLFYLIVFWAVAIGALELAVAREIPRNGGRVLMLAGLASILLAAIVLVAWPGAGLVPFVWLLAAYALLVGIARIVVALRLPAA